MDIDTSLRADWQALEKIKAVILKFKENSTTNDYKFMVVVHPFYWELYFDKYFS